MIQIQFRGRTLHLFLSGAAMAALDELAEAWDDGHAAESGGIASLLTMEGAEALDILLQTVGILSEAGAAAREYMGRDPGDVLGRNELAQMLPVLTPVDLQLLREAVARTLNEGFTTPGDRAAEKVDVGLAELERQEGKKKVSPWRFFSGWRRFRASTDEPP